MSLLPLSVEYKQVTNPPRFKGRGTKLHLLTRVWQGTVGWEILGKQHLPLTPPGPWPCCSLQGDVPPSWGSLALHPPFPLFPFTQHTLRSAVGGGGGVGGAQGKLHRRVRGTQAGDPQAEEKASPLLQPEAEQGGNEGLWRGGRPGDPASPSLDWGGNQGFLMPQRSEGDMGYPWSGARVKTPGPAIFPPNTPVFPGPGCKLTWPSSHDTSTAVPQASEEGSRAFSEPPSGIGSMGMSSQQNSLSLC